MSLTAHNIKIISAVAEICIYIKALIKQNTACVQMQTLKVVEIIGKLTSQIEVKMKILS